MAADLLDVSGVHTAVVALGVGKCPWSSWLKLSAQSRRGRSSRLTVEEVGLDCSSLTCHLAAVILLHKIHKCFTSSRVKVAKRKGLFSHVCLKNTVSKLPSLSKGPKPVLQLVENKVLDACGVVSLHCELSVWLLHRRCGGQKL